MKSESLIYSVTCDWCWFTFELFAKALSEPNNKFSSTQRLCFVNKKNLNAFTVQEIVLFSAAIHKTVNRNPPTVKWRFYDVWFVLIREYLIWLVSYWQKHMLILYRISDINCVVHKCLCVCECMYVYMYVYKYIYICIYICLCVYVCVMCV